MESSRDKTSAAKPVSGATAVENKTTGTALGSRRDKYWDMLLDYSSRSDDRLRTLAKKVDFDLTGLSPVEARQLVIETESDKLIEPKNMRYFTSAVDVSIENNPMFSKELIRGAYEDSTKRITADIRQHSRIELERVSLKEAGYNVDELARSGKVIKKELKKLEHDSSYYVPVEDFFKGHREGDAEKSGQGSECATLTFNPSNVLAVAAGIAFAPFGAAAALASAISHDLNEFVSPLKEALSSTFKKYVADAGLIARYEPSTADPFFVTHLVSDFTDKYDTFPELVNKGFVIDAKDIGRTLSSDTAMSVTYKSGHADMGPMLLPVGYGIKALNGDTLSLVRGKWALDKVNNPLRLEIRIPEDIKARIDNGFANGNSLGSIARELSNLFDYMNPHRIGSYSRFEAAAATRKGVCQDVNFILWHSLRERGIPSYLALGFVGEDGKISVGNGHADVIAYDAYSDEWKELNATPSGSLSSRITRWVNWLGDHLPSINLHLPHLPSRHDGNLSTVNKENGITIIDRVRNAYTAAKKAASDVVVRAEKRVYHGYITELEEQIASVNAQYDHVEAQGYSPEMVSSIADHIRKESECMFDSPLNIDVSLAKRWDMSEIEKPFRPSGLKKYVAGNRYFVNVLPEYVDRWGRFSVAENELQMTLRTRGRLLPYTDRSPEWRSRLKDVFNIFAVYMEPPSIKEASDPRRVCALRQEVWYNPETHERFIAPKGLQADIEADERVFYLDADWDDDSYTKKKVALYERIPAELRKWYKMSNKYVDLRPAKENYTFSPEVISYDRKHSFSMDTYWHLMGDVMRSHIMDSESSFARMIVELSYLRRKFAEGMSTSALTLMHESGSWENETAQQAGLGHNSSKDIDEDDYW